MMGKLNLKKFFLYSLIASIGISAFLGIVVIIFGNFGEFESKVLLTAVTITVTSILGLPCGAYLETGRGRALPLIGIVLSVISSVMWLIIVWAWQDQNSTFVKILISVTIFATACSHLSLLSLAKLDSRFKWSYSAAHALIWVLASFLIWLVWTIENDISDLAGRIIGVLSIAVAAVTVATPIFHKLSNSGTTNEEIDAEIERLKAAIEALEAKKREISE